MPPHAYTEKALVEQSAEEILTTLGWAAVSADDESFGGNGTFGRASAREVALTARLRAALSQLNPAAPAAALDLALDELLRDRVAMGAAAANREVHRLLADGVKVTVKDERTGRDEPLTLRVVDWEHPEHNDFLAVRLLSLQGPLYKCIPDIVLFVNGLPWVVIELKRPDIPARQGFDENLTSYKHPQNGEPQLFPYNALPPVIGSAAGAVDAGRVAGCVMDLLRGRVVIGPPPLRGQGGLGERSQDVLQPAAISVIEVTGEIEVQPSTAILSFGPKIHRTTISDPRPDPA